MKEVKSAGFGDCWTEGSKGTEESLGLGLFCLLEEVGWRRKARPAAEGPCSVCGT